jgi:hypothetical protein
VIRYLSTRTRQHCSVVYLLPCVDSFKLIVNSVDYRIEMDQFTLDSILFTWRRSLFVGNQIYCYLLFRNSLMLFRSDSYNGIKTNANGAARSVSRSDTLKLYKSYPTMPTVTYIILCIVWISMQELHTFPGTLFGTIAFGNHSPGQRTLREPPAITATSPSLS